MAPGCLKRGSHHQKKKREGDSKSVLEARERVSLRNPLKGYKASRHTEGHLIINGDGMVFERPGIGLAR